MDFVESGKLVLSSVKFFVLDEADRLLDTGNQDTIMKLFSRFPKAGMGVARLQVQPQSPLAAAQPFQNTTCILSQSPNAAPKRGLMRGPNAKRVRQGNLLGMHEALWIFAQHSPYI